MKTLAFLAAAALLPQITLGDLFHGTSILLKPDPETGHPEDSVIQTASFYCYITDVGYFTFGWWLGHTPDQVDISPVHSAPDSLSSIDWFELSEGNCKKSTCKYHIRNYNITAPNPQAEPAFEEDYVIHTYQLSERGERGLMFESYFNRTGGRRAIGVRNTLNKRECNLAFDTMEKLQKEKDVKLAFKLINPCDEEYEAEVPQIRFDLH